MSLSKGTKLNNNRYEILNFIEIVNVCEAIYLAKWLVLDKNVIIKEISFEDNYLCFGNKREFFKKIKILFTLNHPNIANIYDIFEENNKRYIVTEYLEGEKLKDYLDHNGGKLSPDETERIIKKIAYTLSYIHAKGIIYGNVNPENIFLRGEGEPVLVNFNLFPEHTPQNGFLPLEVYDSKVPNGPYTDIYSLGVLFFYLLTGKRPDLKHQDGQEAGFRIPDWIKDKHKEVILKAISLNISDRFASVEEFLKTLEDDRKELEVKESAKEVSKERLEIKEPEEKEATNQEEAISKDLSRDLLNAVQNNDPERVRYLLENGANVNVRDRNDYTPLHIAVKNNALKIVQLLLQYGADVNAAPKWFYRKTPLHIAVRNRNYELVELLIKHGADINAREGGKYDYTPLHIAIKKCDCRMVEILLKCNADANAKTKDGYLPIELAYRHCEKVVPLLRRSDVSDGIERAIDRKEEKEEVLVGTSLEIRRFKLKKLLFVAGVLSFLLIVFIGWSFWRDLANEKFSFKKEIMYTHLKSLKRDVIEKVQDSKKQIVSRIKPNNKKSNKKKMLDIKTIKDINFRDENGRTYLHLAAFQGKINLVKELLQRGMAVNVTDKNGRTPLHLAAMAGRPKTAELLVRRGANIEARDKNAYTPLHLAAEYGHPLTVRILLKWGANIEAKTKDRCTPLHLAAKNGMVKTIQILLAQRANIEARDAAEWTPLHWAAWKGHPQAVEVLVKAGANIEAKDVDGWTPLHLAARAGNVKTVEVLLKLGADPEVRDKRGKRPAEMTKNKDIKRLLQKKYH